METGSAGNFQCEACGRSYRWTPQIAGQKVKCACGQVMVAPVVSTRQNDDLYDLADEPAPVVSQSKPIPSTAPKIKLIDYQKPTTPGNSLSEQYFPDRVRDLYMPLGLIGGGLIVRFGYTAMTFSPSRAAASLPKRLAVEGLSMLLVTGVMLIAVLIVGKVRKIDFGPLPVAMMKLCAVAIAPGAVTILIGPLFMFIPFIGGLGGAVVQFAMFFAFLGALFNLDQEDTWYCVGVMIVVWLTAYFGLLWLG